MVGSRIKDYLDKRGIKYTFISEAVGLPANVFSNMLNEKRKITAEEYFKICRAVGVSANEFFTIPPPSR